MPGVLPTVLLVGLEVCRHRKPLQVASGAGEDSGAVAPPVVVLHTEEGFQGEKLGVEDVPPAAWGGTAVPGNTVDLSTSEVNP